LINLGKGPAYDIRADVELASERPSGDQVSRQFGEIILTVDGKALIIHGSGTSQPFPIVYRMSVRFAAILGDGSSMGSVVLDDGLVRGIVAAHLFQETNPSRHGNDALSLNLRVKLCYRDISKREITQRNLVILRFVSRKQDADRVQMTFEVDDVQDD
jgi:hypothetical protein